MLTNTQRYVNLFYAAADSLMPANSRDLQLDDFNPNDVYQNQRQQRIDTAIKEMQGQAAAAGGAAAAANMPDVKDMFPPELMRRYEICILPSAMGKPTQLRQIKAKDVSKHTHTHTHTHTHITHISHTQRIHPFLLRLVDVDSISCCCVPLLARVVLLLLAQVGSFVSVRGIVTRVTDVAPQVRVVCYICQVCGYESYQPVNDKDFTPLTVCPSPACKRNENSGKLMLQTRGSKFVRFQSVRLQVREIKTQTRTATFACLRACSFA